MSYQVGIVGSGNWGTTIARVMAENIVKLPDFNQTINMWVYEEDIDGEKLTDIINTRHENVKYLPGEIIPSNVVAKPKLVDVVRNSTHLVFVIPHQFIESTCKKIKSFLHPNAAGISLTKGLLESDMELNLASSIIKRELGIQMSVLSGANIANEVAKKEYGETTIGCMDPKLGKQWHSLFNTQYFKVTVIRCTEPLEIFGSLKNIIALAVGFANALNIGNNTKAAIIRKGFVEMIEFAKLYEPDCSEKMFLESFGLDDLITTCFGGRNSKCAEIFVREKKPMEVIEKEVLNGQKLQGPSTVVPVYSIIHNRGVEHKFPLFCYVHDVLLNRCSADKIVDAMLAN